MPSDVPLDVLLDPSARVPSPTGNTLLDVARRAMARWSNGEQHIAARALAVRALADLGPEVLRARAKAVARSEFATESDLVTVARFVPGAVLAEALGFDDPRAASRRQGLVTRAIAPEDGAVPVDAAVSESLSWLLGASGGATFEECANRVALLHQCHDATAALISRAGMRLMDRSDPAAGDAAADRTVDNLIDDVLAADPPVVSTTRVVTQGDEVTVPLHGRPFGAGVHACPGEVVARALAAGVVDALLASGRRPIAGPVELERHPHLRIPRTLPLYSS